MHGLVLKIDWADIVITLLIPERVGFTPYLLSNRPSKSRTYSNIVPRMFLQCTNWQRKQTCTLTGPNVQICLKLAHSTRTHVPVPSNWGTVPQPYDFREWSAGDDTLKAGTHPFVESHRLYLSGELWFGIALCHLAVRWWGAVLGISLWFPGSCYTNEFVVFQIWHGGK